MSKPGRDYDRVDLQIGFTLVGVTLKDSAIALDPHDAVTIAHYFLRPTSQGRCEITSSDPSAPLRIDANHFATAQDRRQGIDATRFANGLMNRPALASFSPIYAGPNPNLNFESDDQVLAMLREFGISALHVCGTCRMGSDTASVVDPMLRVRGLQRIRIVDTSIMPTRPSGNTNGPTMAMAWRAADLILA